SFPLIPNLGIIPSGLTGGKSKTLNCKTSILFYGGALCAAILGDRLILILILAIVNWLWREIIW
ncbi:hypothetical protein, partial [Pseudanabaena sp. 'Roaring Creek']|uniref:hypothetical protein n=1 Tax=Pseudanabaena sp. 'Roaring Creek' TaxID=1681830 RepID=UPI001E60C6C1